MTTPGTRPAEPAATGFRRMSEADLPPMAGWLGEPHVARWWGDAGAAIRAYAKAGFTPIGERTSIYGPAAMMARDRTNEPRPT